MNSAENLTTSRQVGPLRYIERPSKTGVDAPTIVFLHGNSFSSAVFQKQFESAQLEDFRLIAFDLPGHGQSSGFLADVGYTFGTLADAIARGIELLDLKDIVVAGWSLGGSVALEMLDRTPQVAGAMIFGAPPLRTGPLSSIRAYHFSRDMFLASKAKFSTADAMRFEKFCIGQAANGEHINAIKKADPNMRVDVLKSVLHGKNRDQYDLAVSADKPLCILNGVDDPLVRTSYIHDIAENPSFNGEIAMIDNAGHAPFVDQSAVFDFMLASFVRRVATGEVTTKVAQRQAA
ncbi:MAG: alpha/beta hydrolase [Pseudomonadota bacterium]